MSALLHSASNICARESTPQGIHDVLYILTGDYAAGRSLLGQSKKPASMFRREG